MTGSTHTRRIFVTGATGYLGIRLIPLLIERGHQVTALTRQESIRKVPPGCQMVVGNPFDADSFFLSLRGNDTLVQLVGAPKPSPWKGVQFRAVDGPSALAAVRAAKVTGVQHFVYVSVAHPAPIMRDYIAVRTDCEAAIAEAGLIATILRPWYILGPGHWWPLALQPIYFLLERIPGKREAAMRLGLVTISEMLTAMVWSIEHPPVATRVVEVPEIRRLGLGDR
ncbi:MAG: NAD(P)H-binding protein [Acidobacteria bacterium]|nr:NAD(P)H-binding protein [Acidobacteriota bacterium]WHZ17029.1 MAG: NAD-dependent epimerase/dehydratase [Nitrospira sp.]